MLNEIISKYQNFSDALISEIRYKSSISQKNADVVLKCMNSLQDYNFQTIQLTFIDLVYFRFIETDKTSSVLINSALLKREDDLIVCDFFPTIYENKLIVNPNSDFIIKCKKVYYEVVEE